MKGEIAMESDTAYLPQEITSNILKRLPAKSLIRFKCVCKDWKNLFKTLSFIKEHLHHSTHKNSCILFKCDNPPRVCLINNHDMQVFEYPTTPFTNSSMCRFFPSSNNGLVLLQPRKSKSFYVWNPATSEVHHVARPLSLGRGGISYIGCGFTPTFNDYKIVRIFSHMSDRAHSKVDVFSLSTRSWKKVEVGKLIGIISTIQSCGFTFDGAIFWLSYGNEPSVVSFDIATEVFKSISRPNSAPKPNYSLLTTYQNKLAILSQNYIARESYSIDLSVMDKCVDDSGEKCIWTKIYTSNIYQYSIHPVTMWGNEIVCTVYKMHKSIRGKKVVLENDDEPSLVFCNLQTNEFKEFGKFSRSGPIWNYVESIITDPDEMILEQNGSGGSTQKYGPVAPRRSLRLKKRPRTLLNLDEVLI